MVNKIENIDIGTVTALDIIDIKTMSDKQLAGVIGSYPQNLVASRRTWRISGWLDNPTKAQIEDVEGLKHGLVTLADIQDAVSTFKLLGYGKVKELQWIHEEEAADIKTYEILFQQVPCIGTTYLQTADAALRDLNYRANWRMFNPLTDKFNSVFDTDRLGLKFEFYLANAKSTAQTLVAEIQTGMDVNRFLLKGWKNSTWDTIGDWGNADAWGASKVWSDEDAQSHTFIAQKGVRSENMGADMIISRTLGCKKRVIFKVTNMQAKTSGALSTDYGLYQLLLQAYLDHPTQETLRPYPKIVYVDGSLDESVPL